MLMRSFTMIAAIGALGSPLGAQQRQHQPPGQQKAQAAPADMVAMHCGQMTMPGMAAGEHRMPMMKDSMKAGAQRDMPMMNQGMMQGMMDMMGPPGPEMILHHKADLTLSAAQVSRLEALQKDAGPACADHMRVAMNAMHAANQLLEAQTPDWSAYSAKLTEATTHMAEGHVVMAKAAVAARDVLTAAQRQTLADRMAAMHKRP